MPEKPLHGMFTAVPRRYDRVNHVITLGLDTGWRRRAARACLVDNPHRVLDICCGTGDLVVNLARMAGENTTVTGLDYSRPMLEIAKAKANKAGVSQKLSLIHGDVGSLPFPNEYFDSIGISFGFRNLTYKNPMTEKYLREIRRVLAPGGRFVIIESSQPKNGLIRWFFHLYLRFFVANVGSRLSGNPGAYQYLMKSTRYYYSPAEVKELLLKAGLRDVAYRPLLLGAASIHIARG